MGGLGVVLQVLVEEGHAEMCGDVVHPHRVPDIVGIVQEGRPAELFGMPVGFGRGGHRRAGVVAGHLEGEKVALDASGSLPNAAHRAIAGGVVRSACDEQERRAQACKPRRVPKPGLAAPRAESDDGFHARVYEGFVACRSGAQRTKEVVRR